MTGPSFLNGTRQNPPKKKKEKRKKERTDDHDEGSEEHPTVVEDERRSVAGHLLDALAEAIAAEHPIDGDGLEHHQEQHGHAAGRVVVHQVEQVHTALTSNTVGFFFSIFHRVFLWGLPSFHKI